MKKSPNVFAGLLVTLLYAAVYAKTSHIVIRESTAQDNTSVVSVESPSDADNIYQYGVASYKHHRGDKPEEAFEAYKKLFAGSPSMHAYPTFYEFLFDNNQFETLVNHYQHNKELLAPVLKDNVTAQLMIAQSYGNMGMQAEADEIFTGLTSVHTDNEQVAYFATLSLMKSHQLDKAEKIIKSALKNRRFKNKHFIFYFLLSKLYIEQNNPKKALETIDKCLKVMPHFDRAILFKAMLLEQTGNIKDAIKGYQHFIRVSGPDETVEKNIVQLLFSSNRYEEALAYMKRIKSNKPEYQFDLALLNARAEKYADALKHVDLALASKPTFSKAIILKVEILLSLKKIRELISFLQKTLAKNSANQEVVHSVMLLRYTSLNKETLIKIFNSVVRRKYSEPLFIALAELYAENGDTKNCEHVLQTIAAKTTNEDLRGKVLFYDAYVKFAHKEHAKLPATLKKAIECAQVYPSSYNLLAYCLAQNKAKLSQASSYIDKALDAKPTDATFMHTKALILEKQKKHQHAVDLIQKARTLAPTDSMIQKDAERLLQVKAD